MPTLIRAVFLLSVLAQIVQLAGAADISNLGGPPSTVAVTGVQGVEALTPEEREYLSQKNSFLLFSGEIQQGDAEKLAKVLMTAHPYGTQLYLDSPGGDVEEALRIASLANAVHLNTFVAGGGTCASACFLIFLAGDTHNAIGTIDGKMYKAAVGYIGLHRPYLRLDPTGRGGSTDIESRQHELMTKMSDYLRSQDVPQRLIDLMMTRPSNDVYWMSMDDVEQLGHYSPGLEELLISRCGYNRNTIPNLANAVAIALQRGDSEEAVREEARMKAVLAAQNQCRVSAFPDLIKESITNTERLRKGWRPWLKANVHARGHRIR